MGIEPRRGQPYFYRKVRRGGRVVSEYGGGGLLGLIREMEAVEERDRRDEASTEWRAERGRMEAEDRAFARYFDRVEARLRDVLTSAGYHRPKRQWRKRRGRPGDAGTA